MAEINLIFINWNTADLILTAVKTLKEVCSEDYCITIVDNGSKDDSCAMLRENLPQAKLIEMGYNSGFATAVNAGLRATAEDYGFILNTDVEFRNDVVKLLRDALAANPKAVMACPKLIRPDDSLQPAVVPVPTIFSELTSRSLARRLLKFDEENICAVPSVVGPCMAIDMKALKALNVEEKNTDELQYFDQRFFFFLEETDFCKKITDAGGEVLYVPTADLMHMQGESANRRPIRARVQFYESRYKFFRKHYGALGVSILFLGCLVRLIVNMTGQVVCGILMCWKSKYWNKAYVYLALFAWHLLLCPKHWSFDMR